MTEFGRHFRVAIDGASHSDGIATFINGCPEGVRLDADFIQQELTRRSPGQNRLVTQRQEPDEFELQRGADRDMVTTGQEIVLWVPNRGQRSQDYERTHNILRPGHGSAVELACDPQFDQRGGGSSSARLTVGHVAAGAVAQLIMDQRLPGPVRTVAFVSRIGSLSSDVIPDDEEQIYASQVRCPDPEISSTMEDHIRQLRKDKDSIGGQVTSITRGYPAGIGVRPFGTLDGALAGGLMDINGVKAVEIGEGTASAVMRGSEHNDVITGRAGSRLYTGTNHAGGILGGKSFGEPIVTCVTFKPTSSHGLPQQTISLDGEPVTLEMKGRHDPCIAIRGAEVVKAVVRMTLVDLWLSQSVSRGPVQ